MEEKISYWKKCSSCKGSIAFGARYFVCSVSTCNGQRTGYVFCRMQCFESHLPGARHRDAGAVEKIAPGGAAAATPPAVTEGARAPARIMVKSTSGVQAQTLPREVLIIASRLKEYIQARAEMNTAAAVIDVLSEHVRRLCDEAIDHARVEGRKTVLERDLEFLKNLK